MIVRQEYEYVFTSPHQSKDLMCQASGNTTFTPFEGADGKVSVNFE